MDIFKWIGILGGVLADICSRGGGVMVLVTAKSPIICCQEWTKLFRQVKSSYEVSGSRGDS